MQVVAENILFGEACTDESAAERLFGLRAARFCRSAWHYEIEPIDRLPRMQRKFVMQMLDMVLAQASR